RNCLERPGRCHVTPSSQHAAGELTSVARYIILAAAFLGWTFSGFQMAVMTLTARSATTEFLRSGRVSADVPFDLRRLVRTQRAVQVNQYYSPADEARALQVIVPRWFAWYNA